VAPISFAGIGAANEGNYQVLKYYKVPIAVAAKIGLGRTCECECDAKHIVRKRPEEFRLTMLNVRRDSYRVSATGAGDWFISTNGAACSATSVPDCSAIDRVASTPSP